MSTEYYFDFTKEATEPTIMSINTTTDSNVSALNLSLTFSQTPIQMTTTMPGNGCPSLHNVPLDKPWRLAILYVTIIFGIIGAILVILWMACNKKLSPRFNHLSRVNAFILNLTISDTLVILLAVMPQLFWEYADRRWTAGPVFCRIFKFIQSFSMMSSNYILVVIAVDRHQAIRFPLKEPIPVWKMAGFGWALAAAFSLPMLWVFHETTEDGMVKCVNIFRNKPLSHRQIWITYICFCVFFIPLGILAVCYVRIFLKVAQKASENANKNTFRYKRGKVQLQSTQSTSLPKARTKTLKLTCVIILVFIVCTLPYFIIEMIISFGDHCLISKKVSGILSGMAACNSACNPFVFLAFNVNMAWFREFRKRIFGTRQQSRYLYTATSSVDSHYSVKRFASRHSTQTTEY